MNQIVMGRVMPWCHIVGKEENAGYQKPFCHGSSTTEVCSIQTLPIPTQ